MHSQCNAQSPERTVFLPILSGFGANRGAFDDRAREFDRFFEVQAPISVSVASSRLRLARPSRAQIDRAVNRGYRLLELILNFDIDRVVPRAVWSIVIRGGRVPGP